MMARYQNISDKEKNTTGQQENYTLEETIPVQISTSEIVDTKIDPLKSKTKKRKKPIIDQNEIEEFLLNTVFDISPIK